MLGAKESALSLSNGDVLLVTIPSNNSIQWKFQLLLALASLLLVSHLPQQGAAAPLPAPAPAPAPAALPAPFVPPFNLFIRLLGGLGGGAAQGGEEDDYDGDDDEYYDDGDYDEEEYEDYYWWLQTSLRDWWAIVDTSQDLC